MTMTIAEITNDYHNSPPEKNILDMRRGDVGFCLSQGDYVLCVESAKIYLWLFNDSTTAYCTPKTDDHHWDEFIVRELYPNESVTITFS